MHLLFLDESGQLSERRFFALGGVALRDRDWDALRDLWQATLADHGWQPIARSSGTGSARARYRPHSRMRS